MKNSAKYTPRLKKLCNKLKREVGNIEPETYDPTTALILGCLSAASPMKKAVAALEQLRKYYVDYNELRVSRLDVIVEVLGKNFPNVKEVARQISSLLQDIYEKRDNLDLSDLCTGSKREAKAFLEGLNGAKAYCVSMVMLLSLKAHAFPVNESMRQMLLKEDVIDPQADIASVQGFLERQIPASQIQKTYALLRSYADGGAKKNPKGKSASKKTTRKSKSKTTRKTKR